MWKNKNLVLTFALLAGTALPSIAQEAKLIAVLQSGASQEDKAAACRQLARVATKQSVPVLVTLLGDEKLSHMARYALETIPDPSVDEALRDALGKLKGRPLQGVIGSLGARRDAKAVDALAKLLAGDDADAAQAAARALGNIGTAGAAKWLEVALSATSGARQLAICEGLLRCAEDLLAQGYRTQEARQAEAIYERLYELTGAPKQVQAAALRGRILIYGNMGVPLISKAAVPLMLEAIRGPDQALIAAATRAAMELPGPAITAALCDELPKLPAAKQVLLANTLGYRGDATAGPALLALATQGSEAVRLVAVQNLTRLGYSPALPLLADLSLAGESELAAAARTCLANFPGREADAAILAMLAHKDARVRSLAVDLIAQRNIAGATVQVLKAVDDSDGAVRLAALKALRQLAGAAELPALLNVLVKAPSAADAEAVESTLVAVCARESKPAGGNVVISEMICGAIPAAQGDAKLALLRLLRMAGGPKALQVVRVALADHDPHVQDAGRHSLCDWPSPDALPLIVELVKTPPTPSIKILALRGLVRLVPQEDEPDAKKLGTLKNAMALADRDQERKLVLSALGNVPTADALALVATYLDTPALREEAGVAAVAIAEKLPNSHDARLTTVMKQVAKTTANKKLAARANAVVRKARK